MVPENEITVETNSQNNRGLYWIKQRVTFVMSTQLNSSQQTITDARVWHL